MPRIDVTITGQTPEVRRPAPDLPTIRDLHVTDIDEPSRNDDDRGGDK